MRNFELSPGRLAARLVPLLPHQCRLTEEPVYALRVTTGPECELEHQRGRRFAVAVVAVPGRAVKQRRKLPAVLGTTRTLHKLLIVGQQHRGERWASSLTALHLLREIARHQRRQLLRALLYG